VGLGLNFRLRFGCSRAGLKGREAWGNFYCKASMT